MPLHHCHANCFNGFSFENCPCLWFLPFCCFAFWPRSRRCVGCGQNLRVTFFWLLANFIAKTYFRHKWIWYMFLCIFNGSKRSRRLEMRRKICHSLWQRREQLNSIVFDSSSSSSSKSSILYLLCLNSIRNAAPYVRRYIHTYIYIFKSDTRILRQRLVRKLRSKHWHWTEMFNTCAAVVAFSRLIKRCCCCFVVVVFLIYFFYY